MDKKRKMKYFILKRLEDETGTSGTGIVAEGIVFSDGTVCYRWLTKTPTTVISSNIEEIEQIHGHDGKTKLFILQKYPDFNSVEIQNKEYQIFKKQE